MKTKISNFLKSKKIVVERPGLKIWERDGIFSFDVNISKYFNYLVQNNTSEIVEKFQTNDHFWTGFCIGTHIQELIIKRNKNIKESNDISSFDDEEDWEEEEDLFINIDRPGLKVWAYEDDDFVKWNCNIGKSADYLLNKKIISKEKIKSSKDFWVGYSVGRIICDQENKLKNLQKWNIKI